MKNHQSLATVRVLFFLSVLLAPRLTTKATVIAPACGGQPDGTLKGRIVFTSAGHGWVYAPDYTRKEAVWRLMRDICREVNEDYGNLDQMTMFVYYCFNAGATVVPMRPVGHQTNEVVLDNTSLPPENWIGEWSDATAESSDPNSKTVSVYYGNIGGVPYRYAPICELETAWAIYTPDIPVTGFYPVYTWVAHGADGTAQLYRIRHTGGTSEVRIPHHMVGNGWVYLGTYYFEKGYNPEKGAVIISNKKPDSEDSASGSVVVADAIRFGNGMGSIKRPEDEGTVSGYPREEEASRYWVQASLGQGQSTYLYDCPRCHDEDDSVEAPPRMAAAMNREEAGNRYKRIYIGFHSNGSTRNCTTEVGKNRGCVGVYNNDNKKRTQHQEDLARIIGLEVQNLLLSVSDLELPWSRRAEAHITLGSEYGEIAPDLTSWRGDEFDATIIEVAFHDNPDDAKLLLDPKVRNWAARAAYHAVVKFMNKFDEDQQVPLVFLPQPPRNVRAKAVKDGIEISWERPPPLPLADENGEPTKYIVYRSTNGYGFGNPVQVSADKTSITLTDLEQGRDYYFRVAAVNEAGESFPSETVGCRRPHKPTAIKTLFVNAFNRFDRHNNLRQKVDSGKYSPPGNTGTIQRVIPRANNSFDYVVQHGKALNEAGMAFDSCQAEAISSGQVKLTDYHILIWAAGQQTNEVVSSAAQEKIAVFLDRGGRLFISGSDVASSLDATDEGRAFLSNYLHAEFKSGDSKSYKVSPTSESIFNRSLKLEFDDGNKGIYWVKSPDVLKAVGDGAMVALKYMSDGELGAAIQYDGSKGGGKVVYLGFPFETITDSNLRNALMRDVLIFFTSPFRLDLVFCIDSTGSMEDDIDAVKSAATTIANLATLLFSDLRMAVVDYRDFPIPPYGDEGDYVFNVRTPFTRDTGKVVSAIKSIEVGGGADWREAIYSALSKCIDGVELGGWRENPVLRAIILMGDAPPHDPEPVTGYRFMDIVMMALRGGILVVPRPATLGIKAADEEYSGPIGIYSIVVGNDASAAALFAALASETGGEALSAKNADEVVQRILDALKIIAGRDIGVVDVTAEVASSFDSWTLDRASGALIASITLSNAFGKGGAALEQAFWYAITETANLRLASVSGYTNGFAYYDVTAQVEAQLPSVGNGDMRLDVGESVTITVPFYSRDLSIPIGHVFSIWADPPVIRPSGRIALSAFWQPTDGRVRIRISGAAETVCIVEASSDLNNWIPIGTVTNRTGVADFVDPETPLRSHRFYRVRSQ